MNSRRKILFFSLGLLFSVIGAIALTIYLQIIQLKISQHALVEQAYKESKDTELKGYADLAVQSIESFYKTGKRSQAIRTLKKLSLGPDGYFFLYSLDGTVLMHSRQPELIGKNLWELKDANGDPVIQMLISRALDGGGYVDYMWPKPSNGEIERKRSYVRALPNWGWMIGTGVYMDDVDRVLGTIDKQISNLIFGTMRGIIIIALIGLIVVAIAHKRLGQASASKEIDDELHRSVGPKLVLIMNLLRDVMYQRARIYDLPTRNLLKSISVETKGALDLVRKIRKRYELMGLLEDELREIKKGFERSYRTPVLFTVEGKTDDLPKDANEELCSLTEDALNNIGEHAAASQVYLHLRVEADNIRLTVQDDGIGFDLDSFELGSGIKNMRERMEILGGTFGIDTAPNKGTTITATMPRKNKLWKCIQWVRNLL